MNKRILSIDVLRGLTIFFMIVVNTPGSWSHVYAPLLHAKWNGCTPTDLVFPAFLFVVGMSLYVSLSKILKGDAAHLIKKIVKRSLILFTIGLLLNWFPFYNIPISELRIFGVLQRIALSFLFASMLIVAIKRFWPLVITALGLMFLHWLLLYVLGPTDTYLSLQDNFGRHLDLILVGEAHVYGGYGMPFDPEGLLGTLSSISQILLGYLIAQLTLSSGLVTAIKLRQLFVIGVCLILGGLLLNLIYPINKPLWSGSYVLFTSGIVSLIWFLLIYVVDRKKIESAFYIFKVFGRNPLVSYILSMVVVKVLYNIQVQGNNLYSYLYQSLFQSSFGDKLGSLIFALVFTMLIWLFALSLYKSNKIIKV